MMILLAILAIVLLAGIAFLYTQPFGAHPKGARLERIKQSPHYRSGAFQNLEPTPMLAEGSSYRSIIYDFFVGAKPKEPMEPLPHQKTDLLTLNPHENVLVWMGHSSYFIQFDGMKILVDPVFSGNASPVSFITKAYKGSDVYSPEDIPAIDYLFITHDHWDHLDYRTMCRLRDKVTKVVCGLGAGAHLERWGYAPGSIIEQDWYESFKPEAGWEIHTLSARHFSGRGLKRNQTLWASFAVISPAHRIYIGGDSGYGKHFSETGKRHGPFDLAILENGQYDTRWKYIHMLPGEQLQAARDLQAHTLLPVHSSKFTLAMHDWDEPLEKIVEAQQKDGVRVITPMIGEKVNLDDRQQMFKHWWKGLN